MMPPFDALAEPLRRALDDLGHSAPTPIQAQALPLLLAARAGAAGLAVTFCAKEERGFLEQIERALGRRILGV